jgi:hypothetical protein
MATSLTGYGYTWWRGDTLPPLADFHVEREPDAARVASLTQLDSTAIQTRLRAGNEPYMAFLDTTLVAYGWIATRTEQVGDELAWPLSMRDRSLWDFVTPPAWRGRSMYPHLLQAILREEVVTAERFCIGHTLENTASQRGIVKAGFRPTLQGLPSTEGQTQWVLQGDRARAMADPMVKQLNIRL